MLHLGHGFIGPTAGPADVPCYNQVDARWPEDIVYVIDEPVGRPLAFAAVRLLPSVIGRKDHRDVPVRGRRSRNRFGARCGVDWHRRQSEYDRRQQNQRSAPGTEQFR